MLFIHFKWHVVVMCITQLIAFLKGSVSEANCVVVWACEALLGLCRMRCYVVVPKVYSSGWWLIAASADGFTKPHNTIFNPYLANSFGFHGMLILFLHLFCVLRVPVFMQ